MQNNNNLQYLIHTTILALVFPHTVFSPELIPWKFSTSLKHNWIRQLNWCEVTSFYIKFLHPVMLIHSGFFPELYGKGVERSWEYFPRYDLKVQTYCNGRWSLEKSVLGLFLQLTLLIYYSSTCIFHNCFKFLHSWMISSLRIWFILTIS